MKTEKHCIREGIDQYVQASVEIPATILEDLRKFDELFDVAKEVSSLGERIFVKLHERRLGTEFQSDLEAVAYLIFGKSFRTFSSVQILCRHGCGADALTLCGSLFENLVDLLYVRQDPIDRARNYIQYEPVEKYRQVERILGRNDLSDEQRRTWEDQQTRLNAQVQASPHKFPTNSCWSKPGKKPSIDKRTKVDLKHRAEQVGFGLEYDVNYHIFCGFKHTTPGAASGFVFGQGKDVDVIVGPNIRGVYDAVDCSTRYFLDVCGLFQDVYGLRMEREVAALFQRLEKESDRALKAYPGLCE